MNILIPFLSIFLLLTVFQQPSIAQPHDNNKKNLISESFKNVGYPQILNFSPKLYRSHPNNFDAVQDKSGVMYFGNLWGLLEFDGTNWRTISLPNGSSCTSLAIDSSGTIYVGGRNEIGFLKIDSLGSKYYQSFLDQLPAETKGFNEMWRTYVTKEGILFVSQEKLILKSKQTGKFSLLKSNLIDAFYLNKNIYVQDNSGLSIFKEGKFDLVPNGNFFQGKVIRSMVSSGNQLIISCNNEGLFIYDGTTVNPWNCDLNHQARSFYLNKLINFNDQYLIASTQINGLFVATMDGDIIMHLNKSNGLTGNTISSLFIDDRKNLWICLNTGLSYLNLKNELSFIGEDSGISGIPYSSAYFDGKLFLATSEGVFYLPIENHTYILNKKFKKHPAISGLVWNLTVIDGKLFCGQNGSASIIKGESIEQIHSKGTWLFVPLQDQDLILLGTYTGLELIEKKNDKWVYRNTIRGFDESSRYVVEDKLGDIWVSHGNKGVFQLRLNKNLDSVTHMRVYGKNPSLPADFDNTVYKLNNEILVTGQTGVFMYDFKTEKLNPFQPLLQLMQPGSHIERLVTSGSNQFWMVYNRGILGHVQGGEGDDLHWTYKTERFKSNWIEAFEHVNPLTDFSTLLGTQEGFVILNTRQDSLQQHTAYVAFINRAECTAPMQILWNGHSLNKYTTPKNLGHDHNDLKFYFTANNFEDVGKMRFQYYLEGFSANNSWSEPTPIQHKEYTNLPPGDYRFFLRAVNPQGEFSKEDFIQFSILSPWYKTWWATLIYCFTVSCVIYATAIYIRRKFERTKRKLQLEKERKLWEKQKELDEARLKIEKERLHAESITLHHKEVMLQKEEEKERKIIEGKNNELVFLTIHITQKNELLSRIKNQIGKTIKECNEESLREDLEQVVAVIQKGLHSGREWEKFREHFDVVHGGFLKRLQQQYPDLKTSSLKLCAYIKMRLSSKQIAILMNTSPRSVIKARYRLRSRLNLDKDERLDEYLNMF